MSLNLAFEIYKHKINPLSANTTKWSNTLKEINLPANYLSVFDQFVGLALTGLGYNKS